MIKILAITTVFNLCLSLILLNKPTISSLSQEMDIKKTAPTSANIEFEKEKKLTLYDEDDHMVNSRSIHLIGRVDAFKSEEICKRLLFLNKVDESKPINIYLSSYGGSTYCSGAIIATIKMISAPVNCIAISNVHSAATMILSSGKGCYSSTR